MSLLFPAYLVGLLGLALPWLLHRFSDQQPPEQLFPSKQFLESTTPPVSRKKMLRYRALLALRVLSLLLLCILFAQPWINKTIASGSQEQHHMIVVDSSLSMRAQGRWAAAIEKAQSLIDEVGAGSAELLTFNTGVKVLASTDSDTEAEASSLRSALDDLQPGYAPGDYGILMQRLDRLASQSELPVKVWLISDLQKSALPTQPNALYAPNVSAFELVPLDTDADLQRNVHLMALAESDDGATAAINVSLLASVAGVVSTNSGFSEPISSTVRVSDEDRVVEERSVQLVPGELTLMSFEDLVLPEQADPVFTVSLLEEDALDADNTQQVPIRQRQPTGVVLLASPGNAVASASVFITTALQTRATSRVEVIRGTAAQVPPDTQHMVTGRDLTQDLGLDVLEFVDKGNNALVFNTAQNEQTGSGPGPSIRGEGVGIIDESHPLALGNTSWFGTQFYDVPEFELQNGDKVLLQTSGGQSILIERPTNRGRLLILNDRLDGLSSNLPLQPSFVELMQSLVTYFDASTAVPFDLVIGERLALPADVQLMDSQGDSLVSLAQRGDATSVALTEPGLYTVVSVRGEQTLRAVLDSDESDLTTLSAEASSAWQARYDADAGLNDQNAGQSVNSGNTRSPQTLLAGNDGTRFGLWQWLLPLAALLLFAESWYANGRLNVRRDGS